LDTADTSSEPSILSGDVDVTTFTPSWSPGVSDDVVRLSIFNSITDSGDGVIEGGSAGGGVQNTTGVTLESLGVSFDGNGNWSLSNSSKKRRGRPSFDGVNFADKGNWGSLLLASSGSSGSSGIWVLSLSNLTVGGNVFHTVGLPSTTASVRRSIAGDELLFGEGEEVSTLLDELSRFHGGSSRESPA